ncbi:metallophosphoesterase [Parvularcula marina]|uniref:Serine/threonine protein phosphatase n=1 Tax=Parvularcula marina TaxID=2292771 RepID=A0A371RG96_9PROT|nr:metallophosphoesterase [Parvularcula marina]RFB04493.1 serine/threonine protein phosphatase [Parvularcula marina]
MLRNLFKKAEAVTPAGPMGPPGKRCYAIGDVHGCARQLEGLLTQIRDDIVRRPRKKTAIVSLGDLIDRGPDSRGVIEQFMTFAMPDISTHVIAGNHEEMLITGLTDDPSVLPNWLRHGGYAFCESYGLSAEDLMGVDGDTARTRILGVVPEAHLDFLADTVERVRFGDYLLVHAGVNPARPLNDQNSADLRWIRDDFLNSDKDFGAVIVHGHTVFEDVEHKHNRISLDTGAYRTGKLTAIRLEDDEQELFAAC